MTDRSNSRSSRYSLFCLQCGWETDADHHEIHCPDCGKDAFLRTRYQKNDLSLQGPVDNFFAYRDWLPFDGTLDFPMNVSCVQADELGRELGLNNLWLLFSCYFPDAGARLASCTFKMLEATGVMLRVGERTDKTLVLSSAGNAGVAVLELGARTQTPAIVVVPESARDQMLTTPTNGNQGPILILLKDSAYPDAIALVGKLQERFPDKLVREGGAWNVARRDAMGVPVLRAVQEIGRIPDRYFQAVGSGTGGIAAFEAVDRLSRGGYSGGPMKLHLVQNVPFTPMVDAWKNDCRDIQVMDREEVLDRLKKTFTTVLANSNPPFGVVGGVCDVVSQSGGNMLAVTNEEAKEGCAKLRRHTGVDPYPEAGAAMGGLVQAVKNGMVGKDDCVLVHLTGGGWRQSVDDLKKEPYPVALSIHPDEFDKAVAMVEDYLNGVG